MVTREELRKGDILRSRKQDRGNRKEVPCFHVTSNRQQGNVVGQIPHILAGSNKRTIVDQL
jgi:hypothetical protein